MRPLQSLTRGFRGVFALLMGSYLAIIFVTLTVLATSFSLLFQSFYERSQQQKFVDQGRVVARLVSASVESSSVGNSSQAYLSDTLSVVERLIDGQIWIADSTGLVLASSDAAHGGEGLHLTSDDVKKVLRGKVVVHSGRLPEFREPMLFVAVPIAVASKPVGAVIIFSPLAGVDATVAEVRRLTLVAATISILLALLIGLRLSRSLSRPLAEMSEVAGALARGQFRQRVKVSGHNEVARLGTAFNNLAEDLARTVTTLRMEKRRTESILSSMAEGVIAVDALSRLIAVNPSAMTMFPALAAGTPARTLGAFELDAPDLVADGFQAVLASGEMEVKEIHCEGDLVLLSHFTPIMDEIGLVTGALGVFQDISQRWHLENMQREFVANVSHELRTPLTSVQGFAEAIADGVVTDETEVRRLSSIVVDEARRLGRLVSDLLDLEKMEAGYLKLDLAPVPLTPLIEKVANRLRSQAALAGLVLMPEPARTSDVVFAEPDRIEQVIVNLLTNSIQNSSSGTITITTRDEGDFVACSIADEGTGIPVEDLPHIWERFGRSRGTGLGLAIVKQIIELHGGQASAQSHFGEGSTFTFSLPKVPQPLQ